ncbi:MAG TPA: hypothetical protein VL651_10900 [Bacteroidia bacterium]|jgi:hypothetical protein|nr:hypothetical protein [Bacteroidia bacterium]
MKFLEWLIDIFSWMKIVLCATFIGAIGGAVFYNYHRNRNGIIIGIVITSVGLIIGIIWATRVWKKIGTTNFLAKVDSSPELDDPKDDVLM